MAYIPQNDAIFIKAYAGAMSGMAASLRTLSDTVSADYATYASIAGAWAESYDTARGDGAATDVELELAETMCHAVWQGRDPRALTGATTPGTYTAECNAILAAVVAALGFFTAQSIPTGGANSTIGPQPINLQGTILIDPQNTTGVATTSGKNTHTVVDSGGTNRTGRVFDKYGSLAAAWGTTAPAITQTLNLVQCSSHTDNSDPVVLTPVALVSGVNCNYMGIAPTVIRTNVLANTVALKRTAPSNMLQSDLNVASLGSTRLKNLTHASVAWDYVQVAGALQGITTPCVKSAVPTTGGDVTLVPGWVDGDSVQELQAIKVNFVELGFTNTVSSLGFLSVTGLDVLDPSGVGTSNLTMNSASGFISFQEVRFERFVTGLAIGSFAIEVLNCTFVGGGGLTGAYIIEGGMIDPVTSLQFTLNAIDNVLLSSAELNFDFAIGEANLASTQFSGWITFGSVMLDARISYPAGIANISGTTLGFGGFFSAGAGVSRDATANVNMQGSSRMASTNGATAVNTFTARMMAATGILLNGVATGFSWDGAALHSGIATTPANLDAAAGAAGFGGSAFNLGGASVGINPI